MKYNLWEKVSNKGSVYKINLNQFEPLFKLKKEIEYLQHLKLSEYSITKIALLLKGICNNRELHYYSIIDPSPIYRGRLFINEINIKNISELWYPPKIKCIHYGRANKKDHQIFYCSELVDTVIFECNPKEGEYIGIIECKLKTEYPQIRLVQLGLDSNLLKKVKSSESIKKAIEEMEVNGKSNLIIDGIRICDISESIIIQSFYHSEFSKVVNDSERDKYKMTIAISEMWFENPEISGIVYPMIARIAIEKNVLLGRNMAIKIDIIDKFYYVSRVWFCRCPYPHEKGIALEVLKSSKTIESDGSIIWDKEIDKIPLFKKPN